MKTPELILIACLFVVQSTTANVITIGVREITEAILKKSGKEATQEIVEFGGKQAIQEVLEKAAKEGGDELVEKVIRYGRKYGLSALETIGNDPSLYIKALDDLPETLVERALWAAQREPATMTRLLAQHGSDALLISSKHRGVGTDIVAKLGDDGIRMARNLNEDQAVVLARYADELAALPSLQKRQVVDAILSAPERAIDYMENHPKVFMTAAGITTLAALKNEAMGKTVEVAPNPDGRSDSNQNTEPADPRPGISGKLIPSILIIIAFIVIGVVVGKIRGIHRQEQIKASRKKFHVNHEKEEYLGGKDQPTKKQPSEKPATSKDINKTLDMILSPASEETTPRTTAAVLTGDQRTVDFISANVHKLKHGKTQQFIAAWYAELAERQRQLSRTGTFDIDEAKNRLKKRASYHEVCSLESVNEHFSLATRKESFYGEYDRLRAENPDIDVEITIQGMKKIPEKFTLKAQKYTQFLCLRHHQRMFYSSLTQLREESQDLPAKKLISRLKEEYPQEFFLHQNTYNDFLVVCPAEGIFPATPI